MQAAPKIERNYPTLVPFLMAYLVSLFVLSAVVYFWGNGSLFLWLNQHGNSATDAFFRYLTLAGDGTTFAIIAGVITLYDTLCHYSKPVMRPYGYVGYHNTPWYHRSLGLWFSFGLSSALAQLLKHFAFEDWLRPKAFYAAQNIVLRQVEGVEMHSFNSFPSGHTITAFCICVLLAFFLPLPKLQVGLLGFAWATGLSRIMIGQHFPLDVLAGSVIGVVCALASRSLFFPKRPIFIRPPKARAETA